MTSKIDRPIFNAADYRTATLRVMNETLVRRRELWSGIGESYDGDRDLYEAVGYKARPMYDDFYQIAQREGIPKRCNNAPCDAVWSDPPRIQDDPEGNESPFEDAFTELNERFRVWSRFNRADKLLGFGEYSVIVLGFSDVKNIEGMAGEVRGSNLELKFLQCYGSDKATIHKTVQDPTDPRFGMPEIYKITPAQINATGNASVSISPQNLNVHWTRIIHLVEGNLQSETLGEPRLKVVYNRLKDIEKILAGSAEMFWRGAFPGRHIKIDPEANWDQDDPAIADLRTSLDEYEHNLRRMLMTQGVDIEELAIQIADPLNHLKAQLQDISAATNVPLRILIGTEEGRLAGAQDSEHWDDYVMGRQREWAEPIVVRQFIDRLIQYGALPDPVEGDYDIIWPDLRTPSDKEKAEVGRIRAEAAAKVFSSPGIDSAIPMDQIIRHFLGLDSEEAISAIQQGAEEMIDEEDADIEAGPPESEPLPPPVPPELDEEVGD